MKKETPSLKDIPEFKHIKDGEWVWEVTSVVGRKVGENGNMGDEYSSIVNIRFIDGEARISGLLGDFTRKCFRSFKKYVKAMGYKDGIYKRIKNGKDKFKKAKTDE